jgi:hypothetical protein
MNTIIEYIKKFLTKYNTLFMGETLDKESWSMMRFLSWFVVVEPMIIWGLLSLSKWQLLDIPLGVVGVIGLGFGGKLLQSKDELKNNTENKN